MWKQNILKCASICLHINLKSHIIQLQEIPKMIFLHIKFTIIFGPMESVLLFSVLHSVLHCQQMLECSGFNTMFIALSTLELYFIFNRGRNHGKFFIVDTFSLTLEKEVMMSVISPSFKYQRQRKQPWPNYYPYV